MLILLLVPSVLSSQWCSHLLAMVSSFSIWRQIVLPVSAELCYVTGLSVYAHRGSCMDLDDTLLVWVGRSQFSSDPWPSWSSGGHEWWSSRDPLPVFICRKPLWAVLERADMWTFWCCPSSTSSADHDNAHPPGCSEGWFRGGCCGVWHVRTMQVFVSRHLPEAVPVDPQGSWLLVFCTK